MLKAILTTKLLRLDLGFSFSVTLIQIKRPIGATRKTEAKQDQEKRIEKQLEIGRMGIGEVGALGDDGMNLDPANETPSSEEVSIS